MTAFLPPDPVAPYIRRCLACGEPVVGPELLHRLTAPRRDLLPAVRDEKSVELVPQTEHLWSAHNGS